MVQLRKWKVQRSIQFVPAIKFFLFSTSKNTKYCTKVNLNDFSDEADISGILLLNWDTSPKILVRSQSKIWETEYLPANPFYWDRKFW